MAGVHLNLEFSGGCEFLVGNQKEHKVTVPCDGDSVTVFELIRYVKEVMLKEKNCDSREHKPNRTAYAASVPQFFQCLGIATEVIS
ncbi:hypothetical protein ANCCAN_25154 [Ancylostoma caninum]|uniref:Ubiquitin-related modifier 1 n=1 Tax=Ancylostoma caninum TaxID=29170 RepID=A0A368FAF7_ANCCA|nr:hypothetical protein ANCCAN_25154 [Ancylostoma caninum]